MKPIAVSGCILGVTITGGAGSATVTEIPSTKVKAGAFVFRNKIDFTIASGAGISGSCLSTAPFLGSIPATATKVMADGMPVCREEDEITVVVPGVTSGGNPCSFSATVSVDNAGQDKVNAI